MWSYLQNILRTLYRRPTGWYIAKHTQDDAWLVVHEPPPTGREWMLRGPYTTEKQAFYAAIYEH